MVASVLYAIYIVNGWQAEPSGKGAPVGEEWVIEEMSTADLKDARIHARLRQVLTHLSQQPAASIPQACGGHAEMTAAYRLFDNPKVTFDRVLAPHACCTRQRIAAQATVLLAQDTTEIDLTRPTQQVKGAGPLDGSARQGLLLHPLHAFTPDGTPLGTVQALHWVRSPETVPISQLSRAQRAATPIEQKESHRWIQMLRQAEQVAPHCPATHLVCLADSESDIYELYAQPAGVDWIVRAAHDRVLASEDDSTSSARMRDRLLEQPVLFAQTIQVRGRTLKYSCDRRSRRQPRASRRATVEVRSASLTLRPPWRADRQLPEVTVNAVLVTEREPPEGDVPIEWLLITSLPVATAEQARQVVEFYCVRWMLEVFFRVLKSGCRVEHRRFESLDHLLPCLAVYLIVAWRTLYVCRMARSCPQIDCEAIFEPAEWKAVWKVVQRTDPPSAPPPLGEFVLLVAHLGGYVRRPNSPPGPQTLWLGLQRTYDFALCWKTFGPEVRHAT